jgi:flagellar hook-associated protein 1 FlgK
MSISSALSNALSGLTVASRAADIVSANIANAMTEGYGARALSVNARSVGQAGAGAWIGGVTRHEDAVLTGQRRLAAAELAHDANRAAAFARIETQFGTPDRAGSLTARIAGFEAALVAAANAPQDTTRLAGLLDAATAMTETINGISDGIQAMRLEADGEIARRVHELNETLAELARLNNAIRQENGGGRDVSALLDAQARLVDKIAPTIPLQLRRDAMGALQLYSTDGQTLLDGRAAIFGFDPVTVMTPDMRMA